MYTIQMQEFDRAYSIMEEAFPKSELRPYKAMKERFEKGEFVLYGKQYDTTLEGIILCWETPSCVFLENFAVSEKLRGKGMGSDILTLLKQQYVGKTIVLEVEEPFDEMSKRRIAFYERNGFILTPYGYMQPPLNEDVNEIPLLLMSYPSAIEENVFHMIKEELFRIVYVCKS